MIMSIKVPGGRPGSAEILKCKSSPAEFAKFDKKLKSQIPSTKIQTNSKFQDSMTKTHAAAYSLH